MHILIDTDEALKQSSQQWGSELAIDTESENNLHHYGVRLSLIQISNREKNWIVDVLALNDLSPIRAMMEDTSIRKIFHDVSFDLRILEQTIHCRFANIVDTRVAAQLLNLPTGLGDLIESVLGVKLEKKFQRADWLQRPLSDEMLAYAANDTAYLLPLTDKLLAQLKEKGRLPWAEEEFKDMEKMQLWYAPTTYHNLKGAGLLDPVSLGRLHALYDLREKFAKEVDRPTHFILSNSDIVFYAQQPPRDWRSIPRVHPVVRRRSMDFVNAVRNAKPEEQPKIVRKKRGAFDDTLFDRLCEVRLVIGKRLGIEPSLVVSKSQMMEICKGQKDVLKSWQKKLLDDELTI